MSKLEHYATAPEDRISIPHKLAYGIGNLTNQLQAGALAAMVIILNLGLGMNPAWIGILGAVPRLVDAMTDPMMGYISDNTRSRFGRRRPYIFVGAIFAGLIFALMWQLYPGHSQIYYFWVFMTASIFFFIAYTTYAVPFIALGYEMTPDYHERTRLQGFSNWIGQMAWLGIPWFYAIMYSKKLFDGPVEGARTLAIGVGIFIALGGMVPAIFNRERVIAAPKDDTEKSGERKGFGDNLKEFFKGVGITFKCKPFIKLCIATFLVFNGFMLASAFTPYVMIFFLYGGNKEAAGSLMGWNGTVGSLCTFAVIPLVTWVSTKLGKKKTFLITISISIVGQLLKIFCYNPEHPYMLLFTCPFIAFGIGSLFTLMGAMVADVCDYDELETGKRREGMFGSIFWWMVKLGMTVSALITGFLLNATGFDVALEGEQAAKTLFLLRVFDISIVVVASIIAIFAVLTFKITEEKAHQIRLELESRRGKLGVVEAGE